METIDEGAKEPLRFTSVEDAVGAYRTMIPQMLSAVAAAHVELETELEKMPDVRVREVMRKQLLMWDTFGALLGGVNLVIQMTWEVYKAMGCSVDGTRRDN